MRPIKLIIKNFLSYGDEIQSINLDINSIISFTGNNGHGKSALLEAITWALWGQARRGQGVSKSDDMIMHLGSNSMFVTLDIKVKEDHYKIHRTCEKKNNRIFTGLELYSCNENEEINLSSSHQKDTQLLIEKIIGISYEMFINTVYLKQGNSNEFSKKTAKERKDILCSILKIDQIEEIRQKILDDIKIILQERGVLLKLEERLIDNKKEGLLKTYEENLSILINNTKNNDEIIKNIKSEYENLEINFLYLNNLFLEKNKIIETCEKNIHYFYTNYTIDNIAYQQYKYALNQIENINQYNQHELNIEEIEEKLIIIENKKKKLQIEYEETIKNNQSELQKNLEEVNKNIVSFLENSDECKVIQLKHQLYYIEKIINYYTENNIICFFCNSNMINNNFEKNIINHKKNKDIIEKEIIKLTLEKNTILQQFDLIKKNIIEINNIKENDLNTEYIKNKKQLEEEEKKYKKNKDDYQNMIIQKEKKKLFEDEIIVYRNKEINKKIKKTIQSIYENKSKIHELQFIIHNEKLIIQDEQLKINNKKNELNIKIKDAEEINKKLYEIENYITLLKNQIKDDQNELQKLQEKIKIIEENLKIKSNLAHILSKNNLQAALIEEAIPIIEEEANIILQKLTNGMSKIYIESIKDLKSGNIKETLDIKIADHIGIRYYEFFSGGESFRIDLALRIALVKLLAQKSGHYIKTFIIDEGFGSQDSQSLEIMIDTLYMLQNEFDLIIIISHLNDMKEQFPIQFHIEKTIQGSIVKLL